MASVTRNPPNYQATAQGSSEPREVDPEKPLPYWKKVVANNVGLLLVVGSELFFAFMHLAVKILNSIDPPVTTFEVRDALLVFWVLLNWKLADFCSNGNHIYRVGRLHGYHWGSQSIPWT